MANVERENPLGFVDRRRVSGDAATPAAAANYEDVAGLRARLTAVNPGYFTTTLLDTMTKNDMVYAVRLADDAAGI